MALTQNLTKLLDFSLLLTLDDLIGVVSLSNILKCTKDKKLVYFFVDQVSIC